MAAATRLLHDAHAPDVALGEPVLGVRLEDAQLDQPAQLLDADAGSLGRLRSLRTSPRADRTAGGEPTTSATASYHSADAAGPAGHAGDRPEVAATRRRIVPGGVGGQRWLERMSGRLARELTGGFILPSDDEYDAARRVWNAIDRQAAGGDRAVRHGRRRGRGRRLRTIERVAAGRAWKGAQRRGQRHLRRRWRSDLSPLSWKSIDVDVDSRVARAGGGVQWGEFDAATQTVALATTVKKFIRPPDLGFTLGGGLGHLMRSYGLACDNLLSADVVTADGPSAARQPGRAPGIFWAWRGGRQLRRGRRVRVPPPSGRARPARQPRRPPTLAGSRRASLLPRRVCRAAPDELMVYAGLLTGPDGPLFSTRAVYARRRCRLGGRALPGAWLARLSTAPVRCHTSRSSDSSSRSSRRDA